MDSKKYKSLRAGFLSLAVSSGIYNTRTNSEVVAALDLAFDDLDRYGNAVTMTMLTNAFNTHI